jgi:hypothetical protein
MYRNCCATINVRLFVIYYFKLCHFKYNKGFLVFIQKELGLFLEHLSNIILNPQEAGALKKNL